MSIFLRKLKKNLLYLICMQISFVCVILILFFGINIYVNIYAEKDDKNAYKYTYETTLSTTEDITADEYISKLQLADCNVKIINFNAYIDDMKSTILTDIMINSVEENYPFEEGGIGNLTDGEKDVILGAAYKENVYQKDGESYFRIFGEEYKVCGFLSSGKSVSFDYKIIVDYDGIGEAFKEELRRNADYGIELILESYTEDTDTIYSELRDMGLSLSVTTSEVFLASAKTFMNEQTYCVVIYMFCFICIYTILIYYIKSHRKEFAIRKINGYSKSKNMLIMYKDIFSNFLVSFLLSMIIICIILKSLSKYIQEYNIQISFQNLIIMFIIFLVSLFLVSIRPFYNLVMTDPIVFLNRRRQ